MVLLVQYGQKKKRIQLWPMHVFSFDGTFLCSFNHYFFSFFFFFFFWIFKQSHLYIHYLGSVWIEIILLKLKTENWKHCSKIIFKCVNSIVGPILMKKLIKSGVCGTHEQYIYALFTKDRSTVAAEEKKKRENADAARLSAIQTYT